MENDDNDIDIVMLEDITNFKPEARIKGAYLNLDDFNNTNCKAICKIKNGEKIGTGFFCKIENPSDYKKPLKALLTCYHVLNIEERNINEIVLEIGNDKKILNIKNRKNCYDKVLDYICIQILKEDNINEFLEIDENFSREKYNNFRIYTFGYLDEIKFDVGNILSKKDHLFIHNCNTDPGWSGGPIFNHENYKVIGLHNGYDEKLKKNIGTFIKSIYNNLIEKKMFDNLNNEENRQKQIIFYISKIINFCKKNKKTMIMYGGLTIFIISLVIAIIIVIKLKVENRKNKNIINKN